MTSKPQPHPRRRSSCHRHPTATPFTGVCASCLSERLTGIQSQSPTITASTANAELKRSKSVSGGHNPPSSNASEPRRKSCDVRGGNTHLDIDRQIEDPNLNRNPNVVEIRDFPDLEEDGEMKPMKELIDLECSSKKSSRKSIWKSASDFSKKLGKWKPKQEQEKKKKEENVSSSNQPQISTSLREIKPEVNDYRLGRRSCDNEPRLPIEFGRFSVDDSRFCLEPPRASWDGYLFGNENLKPPLKDVMPSVDEEETRETSPGGSAQTRDYYADTASSHRRRRSFDRAGSNSNRKIGIGETTGLKSPFSKSPEAAGLFHGAKLLVTEKELRDSNWYSRKSVEFVDSGVSDTKKFPKWKNLLNIKSLLQRRKETDLGENVIGHRHSSVEGNWREEKLIETLRRASNAEEYRAETLAESLQKLRRVSNADEDRIVGEKLLRSYNVGCRDEKRRESVAGQRDCGVGYSRKEIDDGLLRFYLTPLRSYGRSEAGKSRVKSMKAAGVNVL